MRARSSTGPASCSDASRGESRWASRTAHHNTTRAAIRSARIPAFSAACPATCRTSRRQSSSGPDNSRSTAARTTVALASVRVRQRAWAASISLDGRSTTAIASPDWLRTTIASARASGAPSKRVRRGTRTMLVSSRNPSDCCATPAVAGSAASATIVATRRSIAAGSTTGLTRTMRTPSAVLGARNTGVRST